MTPLESTLHDLIRREGPLPFARFMELALYHPAHGYYEQPQSRIGRAGDYLTSVSVGSLFGELLAWRFAAWMGGLAGCAATPSRLVEAGAHDGRLAADLLGWLRRERPALLEELEYVIVEPSPRRRAWQEERLSEFAGRVRWVGNLGGLQRAGGVRGVIFSNELLDALPVRRLGWDARAGGWFEWGVTLEGGAFGWTRLPLNPSDPVRLEPTGWSEAPRFGDLPGALLAVLPDGYTVELCPTATRWWRDAAEALRAGWLVACDYGFGPGEWLRPERAAGTLRAYRQHQAVASLLADPGKQDLTAHVNFPALQTAGEECGLTTEGLLTQERWLGDAVACLAGERGGWAAWLADRAAPLRALTHPSQFGRAFRVLVQRRAAAQSESR